MKRILLALFVFLVTTASVYAHPPSDIKISFDQKTNTLQAVIIHDTSDPSNHYIKKVDIGLNGKEVKELSFTQQDNKENQPVSYVIPDIKDGDVLSVEGYCSIFGKLQKEITVKIEK